MEILIINGSPKGKHSVTLQTVNYLQILHPEHHFRVIHAGQQKPVTIPECTDSEKSGDVVIVADVGEEDTQLQAMIDRFRAVMPRKTRVVNIREYPFRGGCLGCFNCAVSGKCIYTDGFDDYLRNEIQTADAIVYAFTIRDHSMGARFKMYDDGSSVTVTEPSPSA